MSAWRLLSLAALAVAGCASSSGVLKLGPDTYSVSAVAPPGEGGRTGAQRIALTEANQHCAQQSREILVTNMAGSSDPMGRGGFQVTFRCLSKGDPELMRPDFQRPADVRIEDARKR